jgi:alginate O-acetyltransferase complex protein AlgJ
MIEQRVIEVPAQQVPAPPTAPANEGWREARETLVSALFVIGLALPGLAMLFPSLAPQVRPGRERRAKPPVWRWDTRSLTKFPVGLYRYFEGNFGFRGALIRYHSLAKIRWLGVSPSRRVILGREQWLYYGEMGEVDCLRRARPFTARELAAWEGAVVERQTWAAQHGARLLLVICPDKHTIYPEYLPPNLQPSGRPSRYDQLVTRLARQHPEIGLARVRGDLLAAKTRYPVYYRLDTHWTHTGALIASNRIFATLGQWFPQVEPLRWTVTRQSPPVLDWRHLADMLGLTHHDMVETMARPRVTEAMAIAWLSGPEALPRLRLAGHEVTVTERPGAPIPRAVVFGDSFTGFLVPYLSQRIGRAVYCLDGEFDTRLVEAEHPDLVIWELVERRLMQPAPGALDAGVPAEERSTQGRPAREGSFR